MKIDTLFYIGTLFLVFIFFTSLFTKAYKVPRYHDFFRYSGETLIAYYTRRFRMFFDNVGKRLHFLFNFLRLSSLSLFFFEQTAKTSSSLFSYYKKFHKIEENKGFIELLPTITTKTLKWIIWAIFCTYIITQIFIGHLWILQEKFNFYYSTAEAYVVLNLYILSLLCFISRKFVGDFLLKKTIYYETPIRFTEKGEPENIYKPDWNHFTLLKLEDPQHPGKLLSREQIEDLIKKYKSLDVLIDNQLIEMYGQYFIKGQYDLDLKNITYNPQIFEEKSFFFDPKKTKKYWHELELQFLDRKELNVKDNRIPFWIREPLENLHPGIQSVFGGIMFQIFQLYLQLTMNYYNMLPAYDHKFWSLSWGWDAADSYFFAPWLVGHTFKDYLNNVNIFY